MPARPIGSRIFGQMFGTSEMVRMFSDEAMVQRYLDVEAALARAQAKLGLIPNTAARAITESRPGFASTSLVEITPVM